jgi:hypothetical protein
LADKPALVQYLLNRSYFHVGVQVFKQHRGASMGSQWAPILCSAAALMREHIFAHMYPTLLSQPYFSHRYVDNRLLLIPVSLQQFCSSIILEIELLHCSYPIGSGRWPRSSWIHCWSYSEYNDLYSTLGQDSSKYSELWHITNSEVWTVGTTSSDSE